MVYFLKGDTAVNYSLYLNLTAFYQIEREMIENI